MDILRLKSFYTSPLGQCVRNTIGQKLEKKWPPLGGMRVLGLGYTMPYLSYPALAAERCFAFMLARHGAEIWPQANRVASALVFEEDLPLPDASVDYILLAHALEYADNIEETLHELWRVLTPNGKILLVIPNRRSFWTLYDNTPFGAGQPYSKRQLRALVRKGNFQIDSMEEVVHFLPSQKHFLRLFSRIYEPTARNYFRFFGAALLVVIRKDFYQGAAITRQSRRFFMPVWRPLSPTQCVASDSFKKDQLIK
ncbi:class I SAM-dependent methyltransferase [Bartonella sp. DGB2]|uniref:class I SAM-dependent methyltransferase n=1 Tax=Bartonella sp. DGB2 TaxID=3388426 RepID=UPI0039903463